MTLKELEERLLDLKEDRRVARRAVRKLDDDISDIEGQIEAIKDHQ